MFVRGVWLLLSLLYFYMIRRSRKDILSSYPPATPQALLPSTGSDKMSRGPQTATHRLVTQCNYLCGRRVLVTQCQHLGTARVWGMLVRLSHYRLTYVEVPRRDRQHFHFPKAGECNENHSHSLHLFGDSHLNQVVNAEFVSDFVTHAPNQVVECRSQQRFEVCGGHNVHHIDFKSTWWKYLDGCFTIFPEAGNMVLWRNAVIEGFWYWNERLKTPQEGRLGIPTVRVSNASLPSSWCHKVEQGTTPTLWWW